MSFPLSFTKGHGTRNDFVIVSDPDGDHDLSPEQVALLCDRRGGVGGDGLLRVTRGRHIDGWDGDPDLWFMDYRNADGTIAEMCGNGVRVFLVYLKQTGLVPEDTASVEVGTRAGLRRGTYLPDGQVRVWMGNPQVDAPGVTVAVADQAWSARPVDVGNPHAVTILSEEPLEGLDLTQAPSWTPAAAFPQGTNLEFVRLDAPDEVTMRVFERGVGETQSCGTGTVAVAAAVAAHQGRDQGRYTVHVPGGTVVIDLDEAGAHMTGPAVLTFTGIIEMPEHGDQLG